MSRTILAHLNIELPDESRATTKDVERVLDTLLTRDHPLAGEAEITIALIEEI